MAAIAIIGGSGLSELAGVVDCERLNVDTAYGSVSVVSGRLDNKNVFFINRHGVQHKTPPHKINYRANIAALAELGVESILATNAVGGISEKMWPGQLIVPDQLIDYSWGRESTFFDEFGEELNHIDFTEPFCTRLREALIAACAELGLECEKQAVYACTQGPRLETAAEIQRLQRDGCDLVGMTIMPEAALAKEKQIDYASICFCVNWAAGICDDISMAEIMKNAERCVAIIQRVLRSATLRC